MQVCMVFFPIGKWTLETCVGVYNNVGDLCAIMINPLKFHSNCVATIANDLCWTVDYGPIRLWRTVDDKIKDKTKGTIGGNCIL